jgi:hypothetical protein
VIIDKRGEHLPVVIGAQDALDDGVKAVTERVPRHEVDQRDVCPSGHVTLAQHFAAQVVLPDNRKVPAAVPPANLRGGRRFAGGRIPAQDDQSCLG